MRRHTVVITGASSGIGKAAALLFYHRGWNVAASMRRPDLCDWAPAAPEFRLFRLDVTDAASIEGAMTQIDACFGRIDVLVNNAGYALVGPFEAASALQIRRQFETNVLGLMNLSRCVLGRMRAQRAGILINVASVGGRMSFPLYSIYNATKWAVEGFSEGLQYEVEPFNIRIKIIEPGVTKTAFYQRSMEILNEPQTTDYDTYVAAILPRIQAWADTAPAPAAIAGAIYRAATDGSKRLRYRPHARLLLVLRWLLPDALFVRAVKAVLGR